jgi:hypothetical protein
MQFVVSFKMVTFFMIYIHNIGNMAYLWIWPTAPIYQVNILRNRFAAMGWLATSDGTNEFCSELALCAQRRRDPYFDFVWDSVQFLITFRLVHTMLLNKTAHPLLILTREFYA